MNPYEVLGVPKEADEEAIKRAYKKLALRWHPDKNMDNREESERKFKKIGEAMNILSDTHKREMYDRFGTTDDTSMGHGQPHAEMSPDELFQMFFGPGFAMRGQGSFYHFEFGGPRRQRANPQHQAQQDNTPVSFMNQILPLLPILFIFLFSFSGSDSTGPKADFMLERTSEFFSPRYTLNRIPYFVNPSFASKFQDSKSLAVVEKRVELDFQHKLTKSCESEKAQQRKLEEALDVDDPECDRSCRQQSYEQFETESCDLLNQLFSVS
eukprot:c4618_g1_i1.p1 GENE.c4618_g1_i1~~c4618_g1_i1.p1  ORF type:complete len:279 (+),score=55.20 c4618_g1_i1:36-839(+)